MGPDNIFEEDYFFEQDSKALKRARELLNDDSLSREELESELKSLMGNYSRLLGHTKKMVNIGDKTQKKLINTQKELQDINTRINTQNEELKMLNATKDKFFSIISHDLRNPITSIVMLTDVLKYSADYISKDDLKQKVDSISGSIKNLYDMFENLLRWSRSQTGRIKIVRENIDMKSLVDNIFNLMKFNAENKNIQLENLVESGSNLFADVNMMEVIIRNLISNSLKFTDKGGRIKVRAGWYEDDFIITVSDNGVGMNYDNVKKIFRLDTTVKNRGTANETGAGIGLILCKEFVEKHNGSIDIDSIHGQGTVFTVRIPKAE